MDLGKFYYFEMEFRELTEENTNIVSIRCWIRYNRVPVVWQD